MIEYDINIFIKKNLYLKDEIVFKLLNTFIVTIYVCCLSTSYAIDTYPVKGNLTPNDKALFKPIPRSKGKQLTIVSWNVRNLGAYSRSIKDYSAIVNLVDEADVIVLQEVGLGLLKKDSLTHEQEKTLKSVRMLWEIQLGKDWTVKLAEHGSGHGAGRETSMVAYRNSVNGKSIQIEFKGYYELGDSRDMPLWDINLNNQTISIGSVHLTPHDPERGKEMLNMLNWLQSKQGSFAIALGDMNYGYQKTSGVENYIGERKVLELDSKKEIYQIFRNLSYIGKGSSTDLRTNLGFRKGAYFYDQFILTTKLSERLSFQGKLLKDVGMLAFGVHDKYMNKVITKNDKKRGYALIKYKKYEKNSTGFNKTNFDKAMRASNQQANNDATWSISDHRPIWIKLDLL